MTAEEFVRIVTPLAVLEDYLVDQQRCARAVGHNADASVLAQALHLCIKAHAEAQTLMHESLRGPLNN